MNDFLYRGLIKEFNIRFTYAYTPAVCNEAVIKHNCGPLVSHLLSRALTSGVLCSPTLGDNERYSITWQYPGPIGKVIVDVGNEADVRGTTTVKQLMGQVASEADVYGDSGHISVIKSNTKMILSSGTTQATLLDVVSDLNFYFSVSEQLETDMYIAVGINPDPKNPVDFCQGILLQAMPDCDFEAMDRLRHKLQSKKFRQLMAQHPENDNHFELIFKELLADEATKPQNEIHACKQPEYKCTCSREKTQNVLRTLNADDVKDIEEKGDNLQVICQFCSTPYSFTPAEVRKIVLA